ncbi:unnamed protein product [Ixodes hexagonus]
MPSGCGVHLCANRTPKSPLVRAKHLQFHRLPREEPLRGEWCRRIARDDPGQAELRVCSDHFDGDRDYRRLPGVLRDAGQIMKQVHLKPDAVPSLRLPPTAKRLSPVPKSKRRRTADDEPMETNCFEENTPREHSCHCRHQPTTRDTAVQADLQGNPAPAQTPRPHGKKDSSVETDPWLGKQSVGTQANFCAKVLTTRWVQTEGLVTPGCSSATVSNNTTTAAVSASTTTTTTTTTTSTTTSAPVSLQKPGPARVMSPVQSDPEEEEEEEDADDDDDDPL